MSPLRLGAVALRGAAVGYVAWSVLSLLPFSANDAHAYWSAWRGGGLYDAPWHTPDSFVYSPAFAQFIYPLTLLPWEVFRTIWTAGEAIVLILLTGPVLAASLLLTDAEPVVRQLRHGNIDLVVGMAMALGLRFPAAWAFVLLAKVTPGVGLLWFAVRREWRGLSIAIGTTAAVIAISALAAPGLWVEWLAVLINGAGAPQPDFQVVLRSDLPLRLALAAGIVVWAARSDHRWAILLAGFIASPLPTTTRATMLLAILPLIGWGPLRKWIRTRSSPES